MKTTILSGILASLAFSAAIPAHAEVMVRDVEVSADIEAIQNEKAAAYWANLSDDLKNAIMTDLVGKVGEDGSKIVIDIDEVELANSYESSLGIAESRLKGSVAVLNDKDNTKYDGYDLTVTFEQAGPYFLPGTDLTLVTRDSAEYYDAMIDAFADHVVENLK